MHTTASLMASLTLVLISCSGPRQGADLILTNGTVYTVDEAFSTAEAIAIKDHRILAVGSAREITGTYRAGQVVDLKGAFVYPGWIDAHCHFFGYGMNLNAADLTGTGSVEEILEILDAFRETNPGTWLTGRGWDQNDWDVKEFPDKSVLDEHFPDIPVLLRRIDGHAAWVNSKALEMAGVTGRSGAEGGAVLLRDGEPSGILIDNAISLVASRSSPFVPTKPFASDAKLRSRVRMTTTLGFTF